MMKTQTAGEGRLLNKLFNQSGSYPFWQDSFQILSVQERQRYGCEMALIENSLEIRFKNPQPVQFQKISGELLKICNECPNEVPVKMARKQRILFSKENLIFTSNCSLSFWLDFDGNSSSYGSGWAEVWLYWAHRWG